MEDHRNTSNLSGKFSIEKGLTANHMEDSTYTSFLSSLKNFDVASIYRQPILI